MTRENWSLFECRRRDVAPHVVEYHYLHRMPAVTPCCMALTVGGMAMGAVVFALPPREQGAGTWELARLWLADELPHNSESWTIAKAVRHVRAAHPAVQRLVSYADPSVGHRGTIYRAANWTYTGQTDSERATPRFDYFIGDHRLGRASHANGMLVRKVRRQPKHRFEMIIHRQEVGA